jgi:NAD(P)-dependent dehydrogenase (short-subunit alcohol dehydrogenase family)
MQAGNAGRLAGRRALVTGAETGIGRGIAVEFARQGADVAVHYAWSAANAEDVAAEIRGLGRRAETFRADFSEAAGVEDLARTSAAFLGHVDCLVNNAGITLAKPFEEITPAEYDLLFHVNARAQFFLTQALVPGMRARGSGVVCNISSIHALQGAPLHSAYAATKGAILAQTRTLAVELAGQGIRLNVITPGWILVERHLETESAADLERRAGAMIPAGRIGQPPDVARLAAFLCSDDAEHITGQVFTVDGGTTALMSLFARGSAP